MKHFLAFLKATLLGGVIVVFPAWLAVLLVLKALAHLEIFVKPISKHLPQAIGHPRVIAIVLLVRTPGRLFPAWPTQRLFRRRILN
jgi:uncharacterized membrane protein